MNSDRHYTRLFQLAIAGITGILLSSCGTSQGTVQAGDGIYSDGEVAPTTADNRNYYSQYFSAKAKQYESVPLEEEDAIFTDIESYYTSEKVDSTGRIVEDYAEESYGWGDTSEVIINVHSSPYYGYSYGYGYPGPYWHTPHWWYGSGWGISYGYHNYGYHYPFYGANWYLGWNYYPYYGYAYPHHYSYYPYGAHYANVAYNRGRRNASYQGQAGQGRDRDAVSSYSRQSAREVNRSNNDSYSRSETGRRIEALRRARTESARRESTVPRNNNYSRPPARNNSTIRTNPRGNNNRTVTPPSTSRRSGTINSSPRSSSGGAVRSSGGGGRRGGGSL